MSINKQPYKILIFVHEDGGVTATADSEVSLYEVYADVETVFTKEDDIYACTHKIWWWNDTTVICDDVEYKWKNFIFTDDYTPVTEGMYVRATYLDKTISGEIKLYNPSQLGVMLGIDTNKT